MAKRPRWTSKFTIKEGSWVFVPTEETVQLGQAIKIELEKCWSRPSFYYHLKKGGHVAALQAHTRHKYFIHLDIQDFFGHINRSRITRSIKSYVSYSRAREIAVESTVVLPGSKTPQFILPFGFVQSPILASICLSKSALGRRLKEFHLHPAYSVSVYMDDIIVSANDINLVADALETVEHAAARSCFPLNPDKQEGPAEKVTSFNINLCRGVLEITEERLEKFAKEYAFSTDVHKRAGIYQYVQSVNPGQADTFA